MKIKRLTVRSRHKDLERVHTFLERLGKREKWPEWIREKILLAGSEAATNAMNHGNKYDPEKEVQIEVSMEEDSIVLAVEDEGNGFDRGGVPDPLSAENLLRDSGRGLFIIEQLADDVSYLNDGRKLVLRFDASSTSDSTEA